MKADRDDQQVELPGDSQPAVEETPGPPELGILPLRNTVVYPQMPHQLTAGRDRSLRVLEVAGEGDGIIGMFAQRDAQVEEPDQADLFPVGTIAKLHRTFKMPDGTVRLIVQGLGRGRLIELTQEQPFLKAQVEPLDESGDPESMTVKALTRTVNSQFQAIVDLSPQLPDELKIVAVNIDHPGRLADLVTFYMDLPLEEKQNVLELLDIGKRLEYIAGLLAREQEILEVGASIQSQVQEKLGKSQREHYLREQLRHIQKELSGSDPMTAEVEELRQQVSEADLPDEVRGAAEREVARLEQMMPGAPEYSVVRTYMDWLLSLPWRKSTDDHLDLVKASKVLDEDHYGLEKVKERVLEFLAVRRLRQESKGPIICFVGPPGVGKTSLGRSIARAMGREFVRISLGGVHDEAEIRGHRRTYVGALPGRIIQSLKKAGSNNPIFVLDEIDKVGSDFRGDPSAALLEVLDPEQNFSFEDHYLDVPFDLSKVLFITTANLLATVPPALRDRMEEIPIPGYTPNEKIEIARRHLLPRQLEEHGLDGKKLKIGDGVVARLIEVYTREAGLRNLERQLGTLCRKAARQFVEGRKRQIKIRERDLEDYLGPVLFYPEVAEGKGEVGVATGLAATAAGGEILFIEAARMKGKKNLILTGQLGEVMQESAQTALSYLRGRAEELGMDAELMDESDIHLHVPAGATPKEGPSAGVALATTLVSLFTGKPVRSDVAITGEITLRGRVLPVGGIRDKVLAADRAGIRTVVIPARNEKDLEEVPQNVRDTMHFEMVERFDEALAIALGEASSGR
ncbi:endopeptidase La, partial [Candidatus Latescibacterota bacterium]